MNIKREIYLNIGGGKDFLTFVGVFKHVVVCKVRGRLSVEDLIWVSMLASCLS